MSVEPNSAVYNNKVVVLGGGGGVGGVAVAALCETDDAGEIVVADLSFEAAERRCADLGDSRLSAAAVDVTSTESLLAVAGDAAVVINCVGPFYRFGPPTLAAMIDAGVTYVDVCDDLDATRAMLDLDGSAREAGVAALIGMGNSPGLANIFVKVCDEWFLDELHSAEIMHVHGGEPDEGAAVLKHRVHAMTNEVPLYIDGEFVDVEMLEPSGQEFVRDEYFGDVGTYPVFPYPHPETITLPRVFPHLRRATNLGVVYPLPYFELTQDLVRAGMASEAPLVVPTADGEAGVAPLDVMVALLRRERPRLLAEAGIDKPGGCLKVAVSGVKDGEVHGYVFYLSADSAGAGEGTGIPAALGALLALRGQLTAGAGVHSPEATVPVDALLNLAAQVVNSMGVSENGEGIPLHLDHIAPDGTVEEVPFTLSES